MTPERKFDLYKLYMKNKQRRENFMSMIKGCFNGIY